MINKKRSEHRISIKAKIKQNFELVPPVLVLNEHQLDGSSPIRISLKRKTKEDIKITDLEFSSKYFTLAKQTDTQVELRFNKYSLPRVLNTQIKVMTNDKYLKVFPIPVRIEESNLEMSSDFVDFGTIEDRYSRKELRLDFKEPIEITEVLLKTQSEPAFKYEVRKGRKNERRISLYMKNEKEHKGNFKCYLDIKTNSEKVGDVKLPCFGYYE